MATRKNPAQEAIDATMPGRTAQRENVQGDRAAAARANQLEQQDERAGRIAGEDQEEKARESDLAAAQRAAGQSPPSSGSSSSSSSGSSQPVSNDSPSAPFTGGTPSPSPGLDFTTATDIIDSALQIVGLNPNAVGTMPDGSHSTLTNWYWHMITSEGLTDATTISDMISDTISQTGQFQQAFPGYNKALANGYVKTPADYVSAEESATAVMLNFGIPTDLINPTTIGNLISGGVSTNELTQRLQNGFDAVENAPAEVKNIFGQWFGANGPQALATLFLTPSTEGGQTWPTLEKMLGGAQIAGAAAASNLTVSQGLAQRLADMGQTYSSAQTKFQELTREAGLYEQTVGEANKAPVAGTANANAPLTASNQGVQAAFGLSANAQQQVENEMLSRANAFKGGGGASQTQEEGYEGLGPAKPY